MHYPLYQCPLLELEINITRYCLFFQWFRVERDRIKKENPVERVKDCYRTSPTGETFYFTQHPGSPGCPQQLFNLIILRAEFFMIRTIFLTNGIGFLRLFITAFTSGRFSAHIFIPPLFS